jgi:hypothetical protein
MGSSISTPPLASRVVNAREYLHRNLNSAFAVENAARLQAHFDTRQCACDCEIVEIAKVPNSKHAVDQRTKPASQGHVGAVENFSSQGIGGVTFRQAYRGKGRGIFRLVAALNVESPMQRRAPRRLRRTVVAPEHPAPRTRVRDDRSSVWQWQRESAAGYW